MSADRFAIAKLTLLILLSLVVFGCDQNNAVPFFRNQSQADAGAPILKVNAIKATKVEDAVETSVFFGTLKPNRQSQLRFSQGGQIKTMLKTVGETLAAGERIASLDLAQLEQRKSELESAIQQAGQNSQGNPANAQQLQAQLQEVQLELERGEIVAPYDCVIAAQNASTGDMVGPQSPIVTVIESQPVHVEASLPLRIVQGLSIGQLVWIDFGNGDVQAELKTKSPIESTTGSRIVSFQIVEAIDSKNWSFGQTVKIRFLTTTDKSGFWFPVSALSRESTGLWSALVLKKESANDVETEQYSIQRKMLQLIQLEDEWALVTGSLTDGEFVIVNGSHRVVPGQRVEATDVSAQFAAPSLGASE